LRKRTKKLLLIGVRVGSNGRLKLQKFLLLFFKKKCFLTSMGQPQSRSRHPVFGDGYKAAMINYQFLTHAVLSTDEVVARMRPTAP